MERARTALGGLAVVVLIFGGFVAVRLATRFLYAIVWFAETVALFAFAVLVGYLAYRIFWALATTPGGTDYSRRHRQSPAAPTMTHPRCGLPPVQGRTAISSSAVPRMAVIRFDRVERRNRN